MSNVKLSVLPEMLAVCRLSPDANLPTWLPKTSFISITRTADELSIVCRSVVVPETVQSERNFCALKVHGPLAFALTGILAALATPLADAGIPIFAVSTYDTDYLLVKKMDLQRAVVVLEEYGHTVGSLTR